MRHASIRRKNGQKERIDGEREGGIRDVGARGGESPPVEDRNERVRAHEDSRQGASGGGRGDDDVVKSPSESGCRSLNLNKRSDRRYGS